MHTKSKFIWLEHKTVVSFDYAGSFTHAFTHDACLALASCSRALLLAVATSVSNSGLVRPVRIGRAVCLYVRMAAAAINVRGDGSKEPPNKKCRA